MNKRKVPKIRFKGFHDDWEQRKAKELFVSTADKGYPELPVLSATQDRGMIRRDENSINIFHDKKNEAGYKRVLPGQFVIHLRSFQGGFAHSAIEGITSPAYTVFCFSEPEKHDSEYWKYVFTSKSFIQRLETVTYGIRDGRSISYEEFLTLGFMYPSKAEQTAIARYLDKLSDLITLHQRKLEKLKIIKKSMLENCFPKNGEKAPKIRFSGFSDDWEQRKLDDIYSERNERGNVELDILSVSIHHGISQNELDTDELGKSVRRSDDKSLYKHVYYGDLVFNMMRAWQGAIGVVKNEGMVSPAYISAIPDDSVFPEFMDYCLRRKCIINQINNLSYGVTDFRKRLYWEPFTRVTIMMPSVDEQRKITDIFHQLDDLITLHQRKLELLERLRNSLVDRCFIGEKYTMSKLILYHGSPNRVIVPKFGFGEDRHDYGRGFYLTENLELAKEWAVCRPDETNGWVHKYELELEGLNILDFQKYDVLSWLAELMKHRDAADSRRYKMLAQKFIEKYGIDTCGYDVITGWRANASYFYIAKEFVRDNIDIEILEELLSLGGLGIQFCIKSERAFAQLSEVEQDIMSVDYSEFNDRYNERDINARNKMRALVDSDANKVTHVFSTLFER